MRTDKLNLAIKKVMGESSKKVLMKLLFPFRNNFILFNISNRAKNEQVNLDYWEESNNLGDTLSPVVVNYMLGLKKIKPDARVDGKNIYMQLVVCLQQEFKMRLFGVAVSLMQN